MTSEEQSCGTKLLTLGSALASSSPCQNSTVKSPDDDWRLENSLVWDPLSPPHCLSLMSEVWWVGKHVFFSCLCKCYSWWNHVLTIFFPLAFCSASNCLVLFAFSFWLWKPRTLKMQISKSNAFEARAKERTSTIPVISPQGLLLLTLSQRWTG